jgi:amphi-Trp domain-containing protein
MEELEKQAPVTTDETVEAAEVTAEPVEEEIGEEPAKVEDETAEPEEIEAEIKETLTRTKLISRLKAIVCELEGGSLVVQGTPVGELTDSVDFELEYSEKHGKHEIEIELKW